MHLDAIIAAARRRIDAVIDRAYFKARQDHAAAIRRANRSLGQRFRHIGQRFRHLRKS